MIQATISNSKSRATTPTGKLTGFSIALLPKKNGKALAAGVPGARILKSYSRVVLGDALHANQSLHNTRNGVTVAMPEV